MEVISEGFPKEFPATNSGISLKNFFYKSKNVPLTPGRITDITFEGILNMPVFKVWVMEVKLLPLLLFCVLGVPQIITENAHSPSLSALSVHDSDPEHTPGSISEGAS